MKKYVNLSGFTAVCAGVLMLLLGYALGWTDSNAYSLSAAALVVIGAAVHVYFMKKDSKY